MHHADLSTACKHLIRKFDCSVWTKRRNLFFILQCRHLSFFLDVFALSQKSFWLNVDGRPTNIYLCVARKLDDSSIENGCLFWTIQQKHEIVHQCNNPKSTFNISPRSDKSQNEYRSEFLTNNKYSLIRIFQ